MQRGALSAARVPLPRARGILECCSLLAGNTNSIFALDYISGALTLNGLLDRENPLYSHGFILTVKVRARWRARAARVEGCPHCGASLQLCHLLRLLEGGAPGLLPGRTPGPRAQGHCQEPTTRTKQRPHWGPCWAPHSCCQKSHRIGTFISTLGVRGHIVGAHPWSFLVLVIPHSPLQPPQILALIPFLGCVPFLAPLGLSPG